MKKINLAKVLSMEAADLDLTTTLGSEADTLTNEINLKIFDF
jgi:hypothetical protein